MAFQGKTSRSVKPIVTLILLASALFFAISICWFFASSVPKSYITTTKPSTNDLCQNTEEATFYDDPTIGYSIDNKAIKNWDQKRRQWLKIHSSPSSQERVLLVTGSQPRRCRHPDGDNLLLRLFKNKVDYCRIQGHKIFYGNTFLHPKMKSYWVKLPLVYAAMLAHPESEWVWWVDSDAVFTDMEFTLPLMDYKDYNMVVSGWPDDLYKKKSWVGLNAGVFMVRNCQWSMDILREWARMGPISPDFEKWGVIQQSVLLDKMHTFNDDQSALAYLLLTQKKKWAKKVHFEGFYFQTFWPLVSEIFENITEGYARMESSVRELRRRHAEGQTKCNIAERERYFENNGLVRRRPFVTHFCGCAPCSGTPNSTFESGSCSVGLEKALNFADNQVLRSYGFVRTDLSNVEDVSPLPFDS